MKTSSCRALGFLFETFSILLLLTACNSTGYKKSDAAASSMQTAAFEVQTESRAIQSAMTTLNELVNKPAADTKPQFKQYNAALDRLIAAAKRTETTGKKMELKSAAYFEAWNKELATMNYEIIRERSEARRAEVTNHFVAVNRSYDEAGQVVQPLITYLQDIRKALGTDLTSEGLASVKPIVINADRNARIVQTALGNLSDELASSGSRMSSVVVRKPNTENKTTDTVVKNQ